MILLSKVGFWPTFLLGINVKALEVVEKVKSTIEPVLEDRGFELVDLEYRREPVGMVLRLFVDRPGGVDLEACSEASAVVSGKLDETDIIKSSYTLEVSSPGVERRLTKAAHFHRFIGEKVAVRTAGAIDGRKRFSGKLMGADEEKFSVEFDGRVMTFSYDEVTRVNLVFSDW